MEANDEYIGLTYQGIEVGKKRRFWKR